MGCCQFAGLPSTIAFVRFLAISWPGDTRSGIVVRLQLKSDDRAVGKLSATAKTKTKGRTEG